jgi:hypothetical protein
MNINRILRSSYTSAPTYERPTDRNNQANTVRSYNIRSWVKENLLRVQKPLLAGLMATLVSVAVLVPGTTREAPLTHSQIAEANKPGTVLIKTVWTSTVKVNREQIAFDKLIAFVRNQVALGVVPGNRSAIAKTIFDELFQHPSTYLLSSGEAITLTRMLWK